LHLVCLYRKSPFPQLLRCHNSRAHLAGDDVVVVGAVVGSVAADADYEFCTDVQNVVVDVQGVDDVVGGGGAGKVDGNFAVGVEAESGSYLQKPIPH